MLNDTELLEKCTTDESITSEDLGVNPSRNDGFYVIDEGLSSVFKLFRKEDKNGRKYKK